MKSETPALQDRSIAEFQTVISNKPHMLAVISVTFNPEIARFKKQLAMLPENAHLIVVDNASEKNGYQILEQCLAARPLTHLARNTENVGLAAALNQGASYAKNYLSGVRYLLLMDQDSVPFPGAVERLLAAHAALEAQGAPVGCVGPRLLDKATRLQHGFHQIRGWQWTRIYPSETDTTPVPCHNLNGSGTLLRSSLFQSLGGLDESLFIDHVDTEWAFRVLAHGLRLYGIPDARFDHAMGDHSLRFWFMRWRVWPQRSPHRHYFLFRNAVRLMRRNYVPIVWKLWAAPKLLLTLLVHLAIDPLRRQQAQNMLAGVISGLRSPHADIRL